jgi:hypothetical protein
MHQRIVRYQTQIFLLILYIIPILLLIWFIAEFRVNVPSWDEWPVSTIFEKVATHELSFNDLIEPYNQHRYLFVRLLIIPIAFLTNWNKDYELALNVILALGTWIITLQISCRKIENYQGKTSFYITNSITLFVMLSLVQYQNWLWGLQIGVFLVNFTVALAILVLDSEERLQPQKRLVIAAIFCIIASFTMAQGLVSWLAMIPLVWLKFQGKQRKILSILSWISLFLLTCFFHFYGYPVSEEGGSKLSTILADPTYFIKFLFTVIGAPLSPNSSTIAFSLGILIILLFLGLIIRGVKRYNFPFIQQVAPWLSFAVFAILFSSLVTLGRADLGVDFALGSRYTSNSLLLIVALIHINYTLNLNRFRNNRSNRFSKTIFFQLFLIVLLGIGSFYSIQQGKLYRQRLKSEKLCLNFIQVIDDRHYCWAWWEIMNSPEKMRSHAQLLNAINFIESPDIQFTNSDPEIEGSITKPNLNQPILLRNSQDFLSISGEVRISDSLLLQKQSYLIALSYGNRQTIIESSPLNTLNTVNIDEQTLAWNIPLSASLLPLGETTLNAWLYSPQKQQFVRLQGEISVKRLTPEIDKNVTFNTEPADTYGYIESPAIPSAATSNQRITVLGWAILPSQIKQPNHVFLSYGNHQYFIASPKVNLDSPDIAEALNSDQYHQARWLTTLPSWIFPPGETSIKAWIYHPKQKQWVQLNDEAKVQIFPQETTFLTSDQVIYGYIESPENAEPSVTLAQDKILSLDGWARLPDRVEQPQKVMFSYGNQQSFFGTADVNLSSPDVAEAFNSQRYNQVRWKAQLFMNTLPLGNTVIKAWIYHPGKQQFVQLQHEVPITIIKSESSK